MNACSTGAEGGRQQTQKQDGSAGWGRPSLEEEVCAGTLEDRLNPDVKTLTCTDRVCRGQTQEGLSASKASGLLHLESAGCPPPRRRSSEGLAGPV